MLETFTCATFEPHLGDLFRLGAGDGQGADLVLIEAAVLPTSAADRLRPPFSIIFRGPPGPLISQGIHRLEHTGIGTFDLFLVPIGPDADGMRYEAVFS